MTKVYPFSDYSPDNDEGYRNKSVFKLKAKDINKNLFQDDAAFDWMYPDVLQQMSQKHWTTLSIARKAATYLAVEGTRVLDIGSGIGKFCLAAGYHFPDTRFYGVEQRRELVYFAEEARKYTELPNVSFIHSNITQINFKEFDHFYFYNSFYENLDPDNSIDDTITTSHSLYLYYTQYLFNALDEKPPGTRLVTFHSLENEIPPGYKLADVAEFSLLKMWIKK